MCGRYNVAPKDSPEMQRIFEDLNQRYQDNDGRAELAKMKTTEVARTDTAPVLIMVDGVIQPMPMRFGIPLGDGKNVVVNARRETVFRLPTFHEIILDQRCVVPTTGYYEWMHENGKATDKYRITHTGNDMMYLAGIYGHYINNSGRKYDAYAVLTADANDTISTIHDRMPVVLKTLAECAAWMSDLSAAKKILQRDDNEIYKLTMVEKSKKGQKVQQKAQQFNMF